MRFQEGNQRREKLRISGAAAQLACPDSGQVQEPVRAPFVGNDGRKSGKRDRRRVIWRLGLHGLSWRKGGE